MKNISNSSETLATLGCFAFLLFHLWGIGAVCFLVICIVNQDIDMIRDPQFGISIVLSPIYIIYWVVKLIKHLKNRPPRRHKSFHDFYINNIIAYMRSRVERLDARSLSLVIAAVLVAFAIIIFAFVHRSPRYVPVGRDGAILDTRTGKTTHWLDAPRLFPASK